MVDLYVVITMVNLKGIKKLNVNHNFYSFGAPMFLGVRRKYAKFSKEKRILHANHFTYCPFNPCACKVPILRIFLGKQQVPLVLYNVLIAFIELRYVIFASVSQLTLKPLLMVFYNRYVCLQTFSTYLSAWTFYCHEQFRATLHLCHVQIHCTSFSILSGVST